MTEASEQRNVSAPQEVFVHIMDNTEGFPENQPWVAFSLEPSNPFGEPGKDYSAEYPVASYRYVLASQVAADDAALNEAYAEGRKDQAEEDLNLCRGCNGSGDRDYLVGGGPDAYEMTAPCDQCDGSGVAEDVVAKIDAVIQSLAHDGVDSTELLTAADMLHRYKLLLSVKEAR